MITIENFIKTAIITLRIEKGGKKYIMKVQNNLDH